MARQHFLLILFFIIYIINDVTAHFDFVCFFYDSKSSEENFATLRTADCVRSQECCKSEGCCDKCCGKLCCAPDDSTTQRRKITLIVVGIVVYCFIIYCCPKKPVDETNNVSGENSVQIQEPNHCTLERGVVDPSVQSVLQSFGESQVLEGANSVIADPPQLIDDPLGHIVLPSSNESQLLEEVNSSHIAELTQPIDGRAPDWLPAYTIPSVPSDASGHTVLPSFSERQVLEEITSSHIIEPTQRIDGRTHNWSPAYTIASVLNGTPCMTPPPTYDSVAIAFPVDTFNRPPSYHDALKCDKI